MGANPATAECSARNDFLDLVRVHEYRSQVGVVLQELLLPLISGGLTTRFQGQFRCIGIPCGPQTGFQRELQPL
jgi:hypothetical protein